MTLQINDIAPDFEAETTQGRIHFYDWIGDSWCVLFSFLQACTSVCTTEAVYTAGLKREFDRRNTKVIGLSVDTVQDHRKWTDDIQRTQGFAPYCPMIEDTNLKISKLYGMLPATASGEISTRTPTDNQTARGGFVIGPDKRIKLLMAYPMTTGGSFEEILRALDSLQLTAKQGVATPVKWKPGEDVIADSPRSPESVVAEQAADIPEISREEMQRRLHDPSLMVVDVLPRESYLAEHVPSAINLPLAEIESRARELLPDITTELAVYCAGFT